MTQANSICPECEGTGRDAVKTALVRKQEHDQRVWIACFNCAGNGWDPQDFYRWGNSAQTGVETPSKEKPK